MKGDAGPVSEKGQKGEPGESGLRGPQGPSGIDGRYICLWNWYILAAEKYLPSGSD